MNDAIPQERWLHLVSASLAVREAREPTEELERRVSSLLEVFTSDVDPVEDFESYAVRQFVLAVQSTLPTRRRGTSPPGARQ